MPHLEALPVVGTVLINKQVAGGGGATFGGGGAGLAGGGGIAPTRCWLGGGG